MTRRTGRAGITLTEILVAFAIGTIVLTVALQTWGSGLRMALMAQSAASVTTIALLERMLVEDIAQLGVDASLGVVMKSKPERIAFFRAVFQAGKPGPVRLRPVGYDLVPTEHGNALLRRTESGKSSMVPGVVLRDARFSVLDYPAGQLLRLEGTMLEEDEPAPDRSASSLKSTPIVLLVPIPVPEDAGNPGLVRATRLEREGNLPW